jgi:putative hemin transport protein
MSQIQAIRDSFRTARQTQKMRHRDIARELQLSEAALLAAHSRFDVDETALMQTVQLQSNWAEMIAAIESLGEVMALTRNESCVHEKTGVYGNISHQGNMGMVHNDAIDLRLFYQHWAYGFAVIESALDGEQRSLQFFDPTGTAIHKIFLRSSPQDAHTSAQISAFDHFLTRFSASEQTTTLQVQHHSATTVEKDDHLIDITGFRKAWSSLRDTHDFFALLKQFGVSRTQALRLAPQHFAQEIEPGSARDLLEAAAQEQVPIMVFVGNRGILQIHTGMIKKVLAMGPWINVVDPHFSLHLREDQIAQAWIVKKPTIDGLVTSVELFDAQGEVIAMFFGERKPGKPELCEWRAVVENLLLESASCHA